MADLLGGGAAAAASPAAPSGRHQLVVYDQEGLRVSFDVAAVPGEAGVTAIQALAVNSGLDDLADFNLQVGVRRNQYTNTGCKCRRVYLRHCARLTCDVLYSSLM